MIECYDQALTAACNGGATQEQKQAWNTRLSEVFNRGFWSGYYLGKTTAELTDGYGSKATLVKRHLGVCVGYFAKVGVAQFLIQSQGFEAGAKLLVTGPTTGAVELRANEFFVDGKPAGSVEKGQSFTIRVPVKVRENDKLYIMQERQ